MKTDTEADVPELLASAPDTSLSASCAFIAPSVVALEIPFDNRRRPCLSMLTVQHKLPGSNQNPITSQTMLLRACASPFWARDTINKSQRTANYFYGSPEESCGRLGDLQGTWASHIRRATSAMA